MTHASLCKRTHKKGARFQGSGTSRGASIASALGSFRIFALLFLAGGSTVVQAAGPTITTTSLPNGVVGQPYLTSLGGTVTLQASGGTGAPYTWSYYSFSSGNTDGLTFSSNGTITGSPSSVGTLSFQVQAFDSQNEPSNYVGLSITVATSAPLTITTTSLPGATLEIPYSVQLQSSGGVGAVGWTLQCPDCGARPGYSPGGNRGAIQPLGGLQLPAGLTLDSSGLISGTPTALGVSQFDVYAEDQDFDVAHAALAISVTPCTPTIGPSSPLPAGEVGIAYGQITFTLAGCPGSTYTFSEQPVDPFMPNTLPPGLNLSGTGVLKGTPTGAGTFSFYITLTAQSGQETQFQYSITIDPPPTITTSSPLPNGPVGVPYSQQIVASGGVPPYTFSMNANPPGLTITAGGVLNGTPTSAGTFNFNIGVTDSLHGQTVSPFQVTFATAISQLQVAPLSLTFNSNLSGNTPPTQAISVVPVNGATPPVNYHLVIDNGQSNTPAPAWITVTPTTGTAPVGLVVSANQGTMPAGTYLARIQVLDSNGFATDVPVTLNVTSVPQQLTVAPALLNFGARSATPGNLVEQLVVSNSGAGSLSFTAASVNHSSWISGVTAGSSSTTQNAPVFVQVQVNTTGLQVGAYNDAILVSSSAGNVRVPVSLFVAASGPILAVDTTGVLFQSIAGAPSTLTQTVKILNLGDPTSTVNWTATLVSASSTQASSSNWLNLVSSSGTASSSAEGALTLSLAPNDSQLTAGPYYAIVKIADSNSQNSPQYVTAVLDVESSTAAPAPYLAPVGLFFTTPFGGSAPSAQQVQVNTSSTAPVSFTAAASTFGNSNWLSVTPASGTASGQTSGSISVSVNPTGLGAGIYSGEVTVSIGSLIQSVNVTFVVQPTGSSSAVSHFKPEAASCSASKLAITETGLANNFAVPAGWPATLIVQLDDDCASPVTTGNVVASFSNGDPPLNLAGDSLGNYSATWQPGGVNANMVVTLNATAANLQPATAELYGGIAPNQTPPPTLAPGGTLNNLNPVVGAPLSPGTIAQVYGTGLASAVTSTGPAPLPTLFSNTFALVGATQAPLYSLSSGQINIQIPYEVTANQQVPIVLSVNNALTLPLMLNMVASAPGVLSADDGQTPPSVQDGAHIVAQHSSNGTLVSSTSPAAPGEYLVMYLVGMGPTNPAVKSGAETPTAPLSYVTEQPTVTVGSQTSTVLFAGLTPGFVGLYQIDFQVPTGASSGDLVVTVTQNGVAANSTLLPVSN
jgi:large repetitive protein